MDTAERTTAREPSTVYDGFISYSHAADDLLAPRLQSGLQRFAKPWWKRRALRIFRDESSLSANPHLWSSITEALDNSGWFVLLLSPDAADSPWVNQEIEYWKEHKNPSQILPILTDGTFEWTDGDVSGTAVPEQLRGTFTEEPRWVDMRFARDETDLDLKDPRFADAVADIASALRAIPKDELASEEVKQHRRTIRTAWTGVAAIAVLAIAATGFGIQSVNNAERAETEATRANQEAERAEDNAESALEQAKLARGRELTASAIGALERDPELALLLTLQAARESPAGTSLIPEARIALRRALDESRLLHRMPIASEGEVSVDFITGGHHLIASVTGSGHVGRWEVGSENLIWENQLAAETASVSGVSVSPRGDLVAVNFSDAESRMTTVLDTGDGAVVHKFGVSSCPIGGAVTEYGEGFSPTGRLLIVNDFSDDCLDDWFSLVDTTTWEEVHRFEDGVSAVTFTSDMSTVAIHYFEDRVEMLTWPNLEPVQIIATGGTNGLISPDGRTYAVRNENEQGFRPSLWEVESGLLIDRLDAFDSFATDMEFSPDSASLVATGTDTSFVWDTVTGEVLYTLPTPTSRASISSDANLLATGGPNGEIQVWRFSSRNVGTLLDVDERNGFTWVDPNQISEGVHTGVFVYEFVDDGPPVIKIAVIDAESGSILSASPNADTFSYLQLPDGRFFIPDLQGDPIEPVLWDPTSGTTSNVDACSMSFEVWESSVEQDDAAFCEDRRPVLGGFAVLSHNASTFAVGAFGGERYQQLPVEIWNAVDLTFERQITIDVERGFVGMRAGWSLLIDDWLMVLDGGSNDVDNAFTIHDTESGKNVASLQHVTGWRGGVEVSLDGQTLFVSANNGEIWEYEVGSWEPVRHWRAQNGRTRGIALSPDGSKLASTGEDNFVMVWDLQTLKLVDQIPAQFPSDAMWIDDSTMGIIQRSGEWVVVSLKDVDLLEDAEERLTRSFTNEECNLYRIDQCPTLDELRGG